MNNIVAFPQQFRDNSKGPIRFENLRPGSLFRIVAEPSRNIFRSKDKRVYKKDERFFFSTELTNQEHSIVLYPQDLVMPVVREKNGQQQNTNDNRKAKVA